jgi:hypothetical protein
MQNGSKDPPILNLDTQGRLVVILASQTPNPWGKSSEYPLDMRLNKP